MEDDDEDDEKFMEHLNKLQSISNIRYEYFNTRTPGEQNHQDRSISQMSHNSNKNDMTANNASILESEGSHSNTSFISANVMKGHSE